jgi:hypothetical protein
MVAAESGAAQGERGGGKLRSGHGGLAGEGQMGREEGDTATSKERVLEWGGVHWLCVQSSQWESKAGNSYQEPGLRPGTPGRAAARERWELEQQEVTPEAGRGGKWKGGQEAGGEGGRRGTGGARELRFGAEEEESDAEEAAQAVLARVMAEAVAEAEREEFAC